MKNIKIVLALMVLCAALFNTTSCVVFVKKDNGKHKGWFKNPKNPHHPLSTNPGKGNGNPGKGNGNPGKGNNKSPK